MARFPLTHAAVLSLVLVLLFAASVLAADPVEVEVTGVQGAALKNVQEALALPYGLVRDGVVDRLWLDRFARSTGDKARVALEPFGFYHAKATVTLQKSGKGTYRVLVAVVPGKAVRVTAVSVDLKGAGAKERELRELVRSFPLVKGSILLQPEYERAKGALKAKAVSLGYLDADFTRHEIRIAPGELTATIALTLDTGERYYFDDVTIEGAPEYPQPYLERFVSFKKGEVFSYAKLGETQLNFSNSQRFKQVLLNPQKELAKNHQVPVQVKLVSAPRRMIRPGVGYGTDTGARFSIHYRDLNLFHKGHDFDTTLYVAQRLQGLALLYAIPSARDILSNTTIQMNLQQEDTTTYFSQLAAVEVAYNHSLGRGELLSPYIQIRQEDFKIAGEHSSSRLVLPGMRYSKEHFDSLIRPTRGYRYALDVRGAAPFFGSDSSLIQGIGEGNTVIPFPARLSLHLRGKVGLSWLGDPLADLPPSIRFFAGGDQSVRGYDYQSLGPKNAEGEVIGGKNLITGTVELERAIFEKWGVSVFDDVGNAFNDITHFRLYQGAGVGLHYYSPVGGLHVSFAKRLGPSSNGYRIHFTVGFQL